MKNFSIKILLDAKNWFSSNLPSIGIYLVIGGFITLLVFSGILLYNDRSGANACATLSIFLGLALSILFDQQQKLINKQYDKTISEHQKSITKNKKDIGQQNITLSGLSEENNKLGVRVKFLEDKTDELSYALNNIDDNTSASINSYDIPISYLDTNNSTLKSDIGGDNNLTSYYIVEVNETE